MSADTKEKEQRRDPSLREHPRYPVQLWATVKCPDWQAAEKVATLNVSKGGMFLRTDRKLEIGARVEVTLQLPNGQNLQLFATVRHVVSPELAAQVKKPVGVGVEMDAQHRDELNTLIETAKREQTPSRPAEPAAPATSSTPAESSGVPFPRGKAAEVVGIDFGMSYCRLAVAIEGNVVMVPDEDGMTLMPSIVSFDPEGKTHIGWGARTLQIQHPERTIISAKRLLGRNYSDPMVAGYLFSLPLKTTPGPDDSILMEVDDTTYALTQICALMINQLRETAEKKLGTPIKKAVFTCPVSFEEKQKNALKRAAQLAHLEPVAFLEEPVAGALAYGFGRGKNEIIAVYDFGGGTFDFSIVDMSFNNFRVLISKGDAWLGGDDFDRLLAEAVANSFWRKTHIELRDRAVEWARLLMACESAKRRLSIEEATNLILRQVVKAPQPMDLEQRVDRPGFAHVCKSLLEQSLQLCEEAMREVDLEARDITKLVITGGTSQIPFIREGLQTFFEREVTVDLNPQEAVAMGAAIHALHLR